MFVIKGYFFSASVDINEHLRSCFDFQVAVEFTYEKDDHDKCADHRNYLIMVSKENKGGVYLVHQTALIPYSP